MRRIWQWLTKRIPTPTDQSEADAALRRAEEDRDRAESRWPEVRTLYGSLRTLREKNHFIEGFRKTL